MILFRRSDSATIEYRRGYYDELVIDVHDTRSCIEMTPWQLLCFGFKCISAAIWP